MVDHPISLTIDARQGRKVEAVVDAPNPTPLHQQQTVQYLVKTAKGNQPTSATLSGGAGNDLYAIPVRGDAKSFVFGYDTILTTTGGGPDRTYYLAIPVAGRIPADPRFRVRDRDLHASDASYHTQGVPSALADRFAFSYYLPGQSYSTTQALAVPLPSRRIELHSTGPVRWSDVIWQQYLPGQKLFFEGAVEKPDTVTGPAGSVPSGTTPPPAPTCPSSGTPTR